MKYISNKEIEAQEFERDGLKGYSLSICGTQYTIDAQLFNALFKCAETQKMEMRQECSYLSAKLEKLLDLSHSKDFKQKVLDKAERHIIRTQVTFLGEYLQLLRKRMRLISENERIAKEEDTSGLVVRMKKMHDRAKSYLKKTDGEISEQQIFRFFGDTQQGRGKLIREYATKYSADTMHKVEEMCKEFHIDGFTNITFQQIMMIGSVEYMVYEYCVKIQ